MQVTRNDITVNDRLSNLLDNLENDRHERYDVTYDNGDWFATYPTIIINAKGSDLTVARIFVGQLGGVMDAALGIRRSGGYADIYDHLFANTEEQVTSWRNASEETQIGGLTDSSDVCNNDPMSNSPTTHDETAYHSCGAEVTDENALTTCMVRIEDDPITNRSATHCVTCETHGTLVDYVEVRKATVNATNVGWGSDPLKIVRAYLPRMYQAKQDGDVITIFGTDDGGWTLDGYVLPRLASAMIFATEVN